MNNVLFISKNGLQNTEKYSSNITAQKHTHTHTHIHSHTHTPTCTHVCWLAGLRGCVPQVREQVDHQLRDPAVVCTGPPVLEGEEEARSLADHLRPVARSLARLASLLHLQKVGSWSILMVNINGEYYRC